MPQQPILEETKIFISYAHKDDLYFRLFKAGIESHSKSSQKLNWKIWCDKKIPAGALWHNVIQEEIKTCDAAILLVSANFLSSDYIENEEFLHFLERNENEGFIFLPVLLSDCDFAQWENLSNRQLFYPQGLDYGLPRLSNISYSHLVEFNRDLVPLPNPYRETYHMKFIEAFENAIISKQNTRQNPILKTSSSSLLSVLSNKDIINALNLFQKQTREKILDEKELADALDTKNKLYHAIFGSFDTQLETIHKNNLAGVLFDRIVYASELIQKHDIDTIQTFRNNRNYEDRDRSLIVSGLTISLLKHFDTKKIHLLIDFLTDFEEEVWQRALVGLLFALLLYNNRLGLFPEIEKRLNELKEITDIQKSLYLVDRILRNRSYSNKELLKKNPALFFNKAKLIFGNSIYFTHDDLIELQKKLNDSPVTTAENKILNSIYRKETMEKLARELEKAESFEMTVEDFFTFIDYETYTDLNELNPLHIDLKDDLFNLIRNWFIPFKDTENIRNVLANDFSVNDIDILDFINLLQKSTLSDIEKHYILFHIKEFSDDFIYMIYYLLVFDEINSEKMPPMEIIFTRIIRDLYRFGELSLISQTDNVFDAKLSMYGLTLLEKIANDITEAKITSQYLFDNGNYEESLKCLETVPDNKYDHDIYSLFVNNYICTERYNKTVPYLHKLIALFENGQVSIPDDDKAAWYRTARIIFTRLYHIYQMDKEQYVNDYQAYAGREIAIRKKILNKTLESNDSGPIKEEQENLLVNCYDEYAWFLLLQEQNTEAVKYCDEAIKLNENNGTAWYNKSFLLYKLKRYSEAIECNIKAVELSPNNEMYLSKLGSLLCERGDFCFIDNKNMDALDYYCKAIEVDANNFFAYISRANIYIKISEDDKEKIDHLKYKELKLDNFFDENRVPAILKSAIQKYKFPVQYHTGGYFEFALIEENYSYFLTDQGRTYEMLEQVFNMQEFDVRKNLFAILNAFEVFKIGTFLVIYVPSGSPDDVFFRNLDATRHTFFCFVSFLNKLRLFFIDDAAENNDNRFKLYSAETGYIGETETVYKRYHFHLNYHERTVEYEFALVERNGMIFITDQGKTYEMLANVFELSEFGVRKKLNGIMNDCRVSQEGKEFLIQIRSFDGNTESEENTEVNEAKYRLLECVSFMETMQLFYE